MSDYESLIFLLLYAKGLKIMENKNTNPVICWRHNTDCGYRCCGCWDTGVYARDSIYEGDCACIDEGIWEDEK